MTNAGILDDNKKIMVIRPGRSDHVWGPSELLSPLAGWLESFVEETYSQLRRKGSIGWSWMWNRDLVFFDGIKAEFDGIKAEFDGIQRIHWATSTLSRVNIYSEGLVSLCWHENPSYRSCWNSTGCVLNFSKKMDPKIITFWFEVPYMVEDPGAHRFHFVRRWKNVRLFSVTRYLPFHSPS